MGKRPAYTKPESHTDSFFSILQVARKSMKHSCQFFSPEIIKYVNNFLKGFSGMNNHWQTGFNRKCNLPSECFSLLFKIGKIPVHIDSDLTYGNEFMPCEQDRKFFKLVRVILPD